MHIYEVSILPAESLDAGIVMKTLQTDLSAYGMERSLKSEKLFGTDMPLERGLIDHYYTNGILLEKIN